MADSVRHPARCLAPAVALGLAIGLAGCQTALREGGRPLERIEAIQLAVQLANAECQERYQCAPFDETSYTIAFTGERWSWGGLDQVGERGFSARVDFDPRGRDREVEVYYSTDELRPLY